MHLALNDKLGSCAPLKQAHVSFLRPRRKRGRPKKLVWARLGPLSVGRLLAKRDTHGRPSACAKGAVQEACLSHLPRVLSPPARQFLLIRTPELPGDSKGSISDIVSAYCALFDTAIHRRPFVTTTNNNNTERKAANQRHLSISSLPRLPDLPKGTSAADDLTPRITKHLLASRGSRRSCLLASPTSGSDALSTTLHCIVDDTSTDRFRPTGNDCFTRTIIANCDPFTGSSSPFGFWVLDV